MKKIPEVEYIRCYMCGREFEATSHEEVATYICPCQRKPVQNIDEALSQLGKVLKMAKGSNISTEAEIILEGVIDGLEKDLDYATRVAAEALLKIGHRGSNQEDRNNDDRYEKIYDIRTKYKLDK